MSIDKSYLQAEVANFTEEQLNAELKKGYADLKKGRIISAKKAFKDIRSSILHSDARQGE